MFDIRLVGIGECAQNACGSSIVNHRLPSSRGRCLEFLNLWPAHNLGSTLLFQARPPKQKQDLRPATHICDAVPSLTQGFTYQYMPMSNIPAMNDPKT